MVFYLVPFQNSIDYITCLFIFCLPSEDRLLVGRVLVKFTFYIMLCFIISCNQCIFIIFTPWLLPVTPPRPIPHYSTLPTLGSFFLPSSFIVLNHIEDLPLQCTLTCMTNRVHGKLGPTLRGCCDLWALDTSCLEVNHAPFLYILYGEAPWLLLLYTQSHNAFNPPTAGARLESNCTR